MQAALASAAAFSGGAAFPLLFIMFLPESFFVPAASALCITLLGLLGAVAAYTGGAAPLKPALRIMFWGAAAMGFTALIGSFFSVPV